jgi:bifunctional oligoribonuclease and PAP phosphatase NrnA
MDGLRTIGDALAASRHVVILSHANPDPDTVGSAIGLSELLRGLGVETTVLVPSPWTVSLTRVAGWSTVTQDEAAARAAVEAADFVISVDNTSPERLGNWGWVFGRARERGVRTANIDHHIDNSRFGDLNHVADSVPTCTMLIYRLAQEMGWTLNPVAANALFAGLRSDTGGFRFPFGDDYPSIFEVAARLAEAGADPAAVAQWQVALTATELQLLGEAIRSFHVDSDGYGYVCVTREMMERCNAEPTEAYAVVAELGRLDTLKVLTVMTESAPGETRVSVRSKPPYNAAAIARSIGGGGQQLAAGAKIDEPIDVARTRVFAAVRRAMRPLAGPHAQELG